jgi:hypothetical protein
LHEMEGVGLPSSGGGIDAQNFELVHRFILLDDDLALHRRMDAACIIKGAGCLKCVRKTRTFWQVRGIERTRINTMVS